MIETRDNVTPILNQLEEAMHEQLDQPVKGDFMSLTRAWREIIEEALDNAYDDGLTDGAAENDEFPAPAPVRGGEEK